MLLLSSGTVAGTGWKYANETRNYVNILVYFCIFVCTYVCLLLLYEDRSVKHFAGNSYRNCFLFFIIFFQDQDSRIKL